MQGIRIIGTGMCIPEMVVSNEDYTKFVDTSDEWITTRTGIKTRHISDGSPAFLMSVESSKRALADAGIEAKDIDLILHTSVTPDYVTPSMSCILQGKIGALNAMCIDINCACAAFVYALDMARRYLATGDVKNVLIVSTEILSKITDYEDRSTCVLFGDGSAACVVTAGEGLFSSYLGADGTGSHTIFARNFPIENAFTEPKSLQDFDGLRDWKEHKLFMDGREVYKFATHAMAEAVEKAAEKAGITLDEIDHVAAHQANYRILDTAAARLGMPIEKFYLNVNKYGNTSSASIPICLHEMDEKGLLKSGDRVCVVGFGAGLIYGAAIFEWNKK